MDGQFRQALRLIRRSQRRKLQILLHHPVIPGPVAPGGSDMKFIRFAISPFVHACIPPLLIFSESVVSALQFNASEAFHVRKLTARRNGCAIGRSLRLLRCAAVRTRPLAGDPRRLGARVLEPEVVEVYGQGAVALAQEASLAALAQRVEVSGETVFFYTQDSRALLAALQAWPALRTLHRPSNLEDLFLKLTGRQIREEG